MTPCFEALADVMRVVIGPHGSIPDLGRERTEEILLLLLREGVTVPAHKRAWSIPLEEADLAAVHAAGGETAAEFHARRQK
jgi:hypothetical protein